MARQDRTTGVVSAARPASGTSATRPISRDVAQVPDTVRRKNRCPAGNSAGPLSSVAAVGTVMCRSGSAMVSSSPTAATMMPATMGM
jgi:hypothetical protein